MAELADRLNKADEQAAYWQRQCQTLALACGLDPSAVDTDMQKLIHVAQANKESIDTVNAIREMIRKYEGHKMANSWERELLDDIQTALNCRYLIR